MKLLRCPGGYSATETLRRVHVKKIIITPNTLDSAVELKLTSRNQQSGKYPNEFHMKDSNGAITVPYDFTADPLVFDNGIKAATVTNCQQGSSTTPSDGVQIFVS